MQTWFSQSLGDGVLSFEPSEALRQRFASVFDAAGSPTDMAVFTRHELKGRLQCEVIAHFSPAGAAFAHEFGARPYASRRTTSLVCWQANRPTSAAIAMPITQSTAFAYGSIERGAEGLLRSLGERSLWTTGDRRNGHRPGNGAQARLALFQAFEWMGDRAGFSCIFGIFLGVAIVEWWFVAI